MLKEVLDTMAELAEGGMTMICVTRQMGFVRKVADRVIFMDEGQMFEKNEPKAFLITAIRPGKALPQPTLVFCSREIMVLVLLQLLVVARRDCVSRI